MNKINEINSKKQEPYRSNMILHFAVAVMSALNSSPSDAQMTLDPGPGRDWPKAMLDSFCRQPGGIIECRDGDHGTKHEENDPYIARQKAIAACNNISMPDFLNTFDSRIGNKIQEIICNDNDRLSVTNALSRDSFSRSPIPGALGASKIYVTAPLGNVDGMFFQCDEIRNLSAIGTPESIYRLQNSIGTKISDIPNSRVAIMFEMKNDGGPCHGMAVPKTTFLASDLSIDGTRSAVMPWHGPGSLVPPSGFEPKGIYNPSPQAVPMQSYPPMFVPPIIAPFGGAPAGMPHTPFVAPRGGKGGGGGAGRGFFPQAVVPFTSGEGYQPNPNHYIPGVYRPGIDAPAVYQPIR